MEHNHLIVNVIPYEKCFNDNVYFLKYNQCPGCGMPYIPVSKIKKKKKVEEEKKSNE